MLCKFKYDTLGNYCDITSSKRIYASEYTNDGIPFYRSKEIIEKTNDQDISEELFISEDRYLQLKNKFGCPSGGDLLLTSVGTLGIPYIVKDTDKFYFKDGNLTWMRSFNNSLNSIYLYYWLISDFGRAPLIARAIGSSQGAITIDILKKYKIGIPDIITQNNIVNTLSKYDKLLGNNSKRIKLLEKIAEQIYKEWFVRFRFPGYETKEFIDKIPKGWEKIKMKDFGFSLDTGKRPKGGIDDSIDDGIPSLGAESIDSLGVFDYTSVKYISHEFYSSMKRGHIKDGDILLYKDGAYIGKVTKFGNNFPFEKCTVNEHVFLVRADEPEYQNYLFFTLKTKEYFNLMQNLNRNAAQPGLSTKDIEGIKLLKPDINVVNEFNKLINPILNEIFILGKNNKKLVEQRDLLLPRLMSGKLEVK